jgi:MFS family permease
MKARLEETDRAVAVAVAATASAWSPFRYATFTVIWTATVVVNIRTWMYNAATGWLMTSLDPDPLIVSLVQVANNLPMFLFALPAGALADIIDKRKFLIGPIRIPRPLPRRRAPVRTAIAIATVPTTTASARP